MLVCNVKSILSLDQSDVFRNQLRHLICMCRNHEMGGPFDGRKGCPRDALADELIGALHRVWADATSNNEDRDVNRSQRRR